MPIVAAQMTRSKFSISCDWLLVRNRYASTGTEPHSISEEEDRCPRLIHAMRRRLTLIYCAEVMSCT